jgi:LPS O-antigen subunit length determinant protein (WzzB/FepE family)
MKKSNFITNDGEINLREAILILLKNKFLILSISILFSLVSYIYFINKPLEVKVKIKLLDPPENLFGSNAQAIKNLNLLISDFRLHILSVDNIERFLMQSKDFDDFKAFLKSRDINIKSYFYNSIKVDKYLNVAVPNEYILDCTKELNAELFLISYVDYLWNELISKHKEKLENEVNNEIYLHNSAFDAAFRANIHTPFIQRNESLENASLSLMLQGTLVLKEKIKFLNNKKLEIKEISPNFRQILEKPVLLKNTDKTSFYYVLSGLIVGFFLSLVAIFFKSFLEEK